MKNIIIALFVVFALSACTSTRISKKLTAGQIGCQEDDIKIANETATAESLHNWVAICQGKKFVCSYHPSDSVSCKEALDQNMKLEDIQE